MNAETTLVLGGARSGKSRYSEGLAAHWQGAKVYIATSQIFDDEMKMRVEAHKHQRRNADWLTVEEPLDLVGALRTSMDDQTFVLVDCLTLWLTNLILGEHDTDEAIDNLCTQLQNVRGQVVLVANEVGLGIVPENALARRFRDVAGLCNQRVAGVCNKAVFIAAGLPITLKG